MMTKLFEYMRARVAERSTWGFWFGAAGVIAMATFPANVFLALAVFAAGFVPDGTIIPSKTDVG
jgi:hypothetical protein